MEIMDFIIVLRSAAIVTIMLIILNEGREKIHPHKNRGNWTEEETREHLKRYHPDAYRAMIEVEKEES